MKKLYILTVLLISLMLPLGALAAVDIMMEDTSSAEDYSISITVDTGIDTLDEIVLPIEFSDDVIITNVGTGTIICSNFNNTEDNNILTITCELDSPTSLNGILANIDFTSTTEDYSFVVLENDPSLSIGGLELGMVTNIEAMEFTTMDNDLDTGFDNDVVIPEDDFMVTTEDDPFMQPQQEESNGIMDFLPYILIGGSVVLLISIVGILLSKKGSSKKSDYTPVDDTPTPTPETPQQAPVQDGTLRDMVNSNNPTAQQQVPPTNAPTPPPVQPVQQEETQVSPAPGFDQPVMPNTEPSIQPTEDTPVFDQSAIPNTQATQDTPTFGDPTTSPGFDQPVTPDTQPTQDTPTFGEPVNSPGFDQPVTQETQPTENTPDLTQTPSAPTTSSTEEQDLQDILNSESSGINMGATAVQTEPETTPQPIDQQPQTTTTVTPEEELQNNIQRELGQFQSAPQDDASGINLQQDQPRTEGDDGNMPPTPPTM